MYYQGDHNWWLGDLQAWQLNWGTTPIGNTVGFGPLLDDEHSIWIGDFAQLGHPQVLMYYQGDDNWWLGDLQAGKLNWGTTPIGNTFGFGPLLDGEHPIWIGDFAQLGHPQVLMYYQGDHNWWLGDLFALQLSNLANLTVGLCLMGQPTPNQNVLFANRNNVPAGDLVVYVAQTLLGGAGNFVGCAAFPAGRPGAVIVQNAASWLLAHEVGHVLGLPHVPNAPSTNTDSLMWPFTTWTNVPPDISDGESTILHLSPFTREC